MLYAIVFITGAAILALELLASRIMTPYFGVNLFIWTGILSITLIALAAGYWWGGRLAAPSARAPSLTRLVTLYATMPAVAALAIVVACLLYPFAFLPLARFDLIAGAFAAGFILLFVPLAATSAMNPLLVATRVAAGGSALGDAGAGRVFFVSTLGSVVGVLLTAFALIPNVSNFSAALLVAVVLASLTLAIAAKPPCALTARARLATLGASALACAVGLLVIAPAVLQTQWPARYGSRDWQRETTYHSMFGTIKVLRSAADENGSYRRMYFQDGITQNTVAGDGYSLSLYTYALDALARAYRPTAQRALVLGLGAGMVPRALAARGLAVTVVEIDPASLRAARESFGFPASIPVAVEDARTFLRRCETPYDVVILDLFAGDGIPEYLVTREFFHDLQRCTGNDGVAVFNTFADLRYTPPYAHFLRTLRSVFPAIVVYRPDYPGAVQINSFVVAAVTRLPEPAYVPVRQAPDIVASVLADMLRHPRLVDRSLLEDSRVITDALNPVAMDIARGQARHREAVVEAVPAAFLFN